LQRHFARAIIIHLGHFPRAEAWQAILFRLLKVFDEMKRNGFSNEFFKYASSTEASFVKATDIAKGFGHTISRAKAVTQEGPSTGRAPSGCLPAQR
jgi:hypothetical protein